MCGLIGMAGNLTSVLETKAFRDMLDVCQVRGRDSTGVFKVRRDLSYDWCKNVGPPPFLFDLRMFDQVMARGQAKVMAGHCRSATIGSVKVQNAHPFEIENDFIGMHNGTLKGYHKLDTYDSRLVDSEMLMLSIRKHGAEKTFHEIEGAWACVWFDGRDNTLNMIRNKERPLYLVRTKNREVLAWASEVWMFGALGRYVELDQPVLLAENSLLTYPLPEGNGEIGEPISLAIEPKKMDFHFMSDRGTHYISNGQENLPLVSRMKKKEKKGAQNPFSVVGGRDAKFTDIRVVAGTEYITDKHTGREWKSQDFFHNTGGACCFCENPFKSLNEVAEFISQDWALCQECSEGMNAPKIA